MVAQVRGAAAPNVPVASSGPGVRPQKDSQGTPSIVVARGSGKLSFYEAKDGFNKRLPADVLQKHIQASYAVALS